MTNIEMYTTPSANQRGEREQRERERESKSANGTVQRLTLSLSTQRLGEKEDAQRQRLLKIG